MPMAAIIEDMTNLPTSDEKRIGQELAMTAPGDGFSAHDGDSVFFCERFDFGHDLCELRRQHKIRISSKGAHFPRCVRRICGGFAKAAQVSPPYVVDSLGFKRGGQCLAAEMRITP